MLTDKKRSLPKPELWGGIECTINRIGDTYRDQLRYAGHYDRPDDLEYITKLPLKAIRYPILWETHEPLPGAAINWSRTRTQLELLRKKSITPIAGLLHHGSGPSFTNLLDENFPQKFSSYAFQVASTFPWIEFYTPVNEPLTTARFSGLYGLWYPHHQSDKSFLSILINQLKGTVLAMQAIRTVNPAAKLVQPEDLSFTHSTPFLQYQADFENHRRWITYDLLCGKVSDLHPLWNYFLSHDISPASLQFFVDNPCPPDIIGVNYYVTSERYLDHHTERHPKESRGGNGKHRYADIEAVRITKPVGLYELLRTLWQRYKIPIAITEAHLSCTREEQMRWLKEIWEIAQSAMDSGVDVKAVTAWSLLGAFDWDSLLTKDQGHYENGVFDVRSNTLRKTALLKLLQTLTDDQPFIHPVLKTKGWWHHESIGDAQLSGTMRPLIIIGKNSALAKGFMKACRHRNIRCMAFSHHDLIFAEENISHLLTQHNPWAVINATGYLSIEDAESNPAQYFELHAEIPALLADLCRKHSIHFLTISSDLVFDGKKNSPYEEQDAVMPLNVFGRSKAAGERKVIAINPAALIIRTCGLFDAFDHRNFVSCVLESLKTNQTVPALEDVLVSPTYIPHFVDAALDLLIDEASGTWHLSNSGNTSWREFAIDIARRGRYNPDRIVTRKISDMNWKATRPSYSVLTSKSGIILPSLGNALTRYFEEINN